jgi:hypothetical protein
MTGDDHEEARRFWSKPRKLILWRRRRSVPAHCVSGLAPEARDGTLSYRVSVSFRGTYISRRPNIRSAFESPSSIGSRA